MSDHPDPAELAMVADHELDEMEDGSRIAALVAHVEGCARCRYAVAEVRHVTAALIIDVAPPADLLERILERRAGGEQPLLVLADADAHPGRRELEEYAGLALDDDAAEFVRSHVESCDRCRDVVDRIRRSAAALALASEPPVDLLQRIRSRWDAGERAILPAARAPESAGRRRRDEEREVSGRGLDDEDDDLLDDDAAEGPDDEDEPDER